MTSEWPPWQKAACLLAGGVGGWVLVGLIALIVRAVLG